MPSRHLSSRGAIVALLALGLGAAVRPASAQCVNQTADARCTRIDFHEYASPVSTEYQATLGRPLTSHGFEFYAFGSNFADGGPSSNALATWGTADTDLGKKNLPSNLGSSTTLFGSLNGDALSLFPRTGGTRFNLYSMDVGALFRQSSISPPLGGLQTFYLYFEYYKSLNAFSTGISDGAMVALISRPPLVDGDRVPVLETLDFVNGVNLYNGASMIWFDGSPTDLATGVYGLNWWQAGLVPNATGQLTIQTGSGYLHQFTNVELALLPEPSEIALLATGLLIIGGVAVRRRRTS